jgi:PAS domain S-box-containing protein
MTFHELLSNYVTPLTFAALAVVAFVRWRQLGEAVRAWMAATFGVIGFVVVVGLFLPEDSDSSIVEWIERINIAIVVLFPYFLYRFSLTFFTRVRWFWWVAHILTAAAIVGALLVPEFPDEGEPRSTAFNVYIQVLLVQWVVLSGWVAVRLWRAGRAQPTISRRRMQTLAMGAAGLAFTLVLAGEAQSGDEGSALDVAVQLLALGSAAMFLLGFAPPAFVRAAWRRPEESKARVAEADLMEALTASDVATALLPHISQLAGGRGSLLTDEKGMVIGYHGLSEPEATELARVLAAVEAREIGPYRDLGTVLAVPIRSGSLVVVTSPFAPYFGREETELLQHLAFLADLALARTELYQRERESRRQLLEAEAIAHLGSWEWDVETNRISWSEEMYVITGVDPDTFEPSYESFMACVHPDDRDAVARVTEQALQDRESVNVEYRVARPDGAVAVVQGRARVVLDLRGKVVKMVGTAQDVTERKRHEEFRDRFIANAAHEMRTPLAALLGFLEVLSKRRRELPPDKIEMMMDAIGRSGERLTILLNNLLDLTRFQEGEFVISPEPVDVARLCRTIVEEIPPPDGKRVDVRADGDAVALVDPARLAQVLSNLLTNAYRYGGPNIALAAETSDGDIVVSITDDGPGVEEELRSRVFDPFSRGTMSSTVGGSGLGLAIVKTLVDALGDEIWYEAPEGGGARFCVRLKKAS